MAIICLNSRDSLVLINIDKVVYMQANGNYTNIVYIEGLKNMVSVGLSKMEELIRQSYRHGETTPFLRMGRSLIINQTFLFQINILKQKLILSDFGSHHYSLPVPRQLLKEYKEVVHARTGLKIKEQ